MKQVNAFLLCAVILFSFAACGSTQGTGDVLPPASDTPPPKPYDAYRAACSVLSAEDTVYCVETRILVTMGDSTVDIHQVYRTDGGAHDLYSFYSSATETHTRQYIYTGGTAYIAINDDKTKGRMTEDAFCAQFMPARIADPGLLGFTAMQFYGIHTVTEIGGYYFTLHAEANKGADAFLRGALGESAYALYENATPGPITYRLHFNKDGVLRSIMTEFDMLYDGNILTVSAATSYTHIGEGETVAMPADAADYRPLIGE